MTTKEMAHEVIDALPDQASMDDIIHALYVRAKFERGLREVREGQGIPHREVKKRLKKWVKSSRRPRPGRIRKTAPGTSGGQWYGRGDCSPSL